jgi:hypothetical protein
MHPHQVNRNETQFHPKSGLKRFQNIPSSPISALGALFKSSKYYRYSSGLNLAAALTLSPIEGFETASMHLLSSEPRENLWSSPALLRPFSIETSRFSRDS